MKDTKAREEIGLLDEGMKKLKENLNVLEGLLVRDCPRCKHETIQKEACNPWSYGFILAWGEDTPKRKSNTTQCLVCGATINNECKLVAKPLTAKKSKKVKK